MNPLLSNVLDQIIERMESGKLDWTKSWSATELPHNAKTGRPYSGFNLFLTMYSGYAKTGWLTFNQVKEMGGHVIKGSKATPIVYWQPKEYKKINAAGVEETKKGLICKLYYIFNQEQIAGIEFKEAPVRETSDATSIQAMCAAMQVELRHMNFDRAYYSPGQDQITMPYQHDFNSDADYIATLFHEMTHATGHAKRLKRELTGMMNKESYSFEELIAELGASFLCAINGVQNDVENSAAYIQGWAKVIKADKMMLYKAAAAAQKAVNFIMQANNGEEVEELELIEVEA